MMEAPKEEEKPKTKPESSAVQEPSKPSLPAIITVDNKKGTDGKPDAPVKEAAADDPSFRQANTPKHANKTIARTESIENVAKKEPTDSEKEERKDTPDRSKEASTSYPAQERAQHPAQKLGGPPMDAGPQPKQGQPLPNQQGYYRGSGDAYPPRPFEGPERHGRQPTVGGGNGAFSPTTPYKSREASNHQEYYNGRALPTVSPSGNRGGDYRSGSYQYREQHEYRNGPGNSRYGPPYMPDGRGPPPLELRSSDHRPGDAHYSGGRYDHGGGYQRYPGQQYGASGSGHPAQYGPSGSGPHSGPPYPSSQPYNRGPPASSGYQDHRHGYGGPSSSGTPPFQGRPPSYGAQHRPHPGPPPPHPGQGDPSADYQRQTPPESMGGGFTRAVSSSFDRSIKSRTSDTEKAGGHHPDNVSKIEPPTDPRYASQNAPHSHDDGASAVPSDDDSWRQLKQVASVDEDALRARIKQKKEEKSGTAAMPPQKEDGVHDQESTSSSLTNSHPNTRTQMGTVPPAGNKPPMPTPSKLASLDSLSSVASAQEPIDTESSKDGSLDLMKCSSGSSGLLKGFPEGHQREPSDGSSLNVPVEYRLQNKRSREQRGDANSNKDMAADEIRRGPSQEDRPQGSKNPAKRSRHEEKPASEEPSASSKKGTTKQLKSSPLSMACSPPHSPSAEKRNSQGEKARSRGDVPHHPHATHPHGKDPSESNISFTSSPGLASSSYFDKPPLYSYSMDSAHSFTRDGSRSGYPPRPGSSSSSTMTPMGSGPTTSEGGQRDGVGPSLPSWDLQIQDSFGGGSASGAPLMSSFSFSKDYPMLANSGSNLGYNGVTSGNGSGGQNLPQSLPGQPHSVPPPQPGRPHNGPPPHVAESRNQSFDGGHYHGSFSRSGSIDIAYDANGRPQPGQPPYNENYKPSQHGGQFPPHAPSWSTTTSNGSGGQAHAPSSFRGPAGGPPHGQFSQYKSHHQQRTGPPGSHSPTPHHGPSHQYHGGMMRNFSHDSAVRTSPPPGPPGSHMMHSAPPHGGGMSAPSAFQPPPEFAAPPNTHLQRRPPPAVYIMSSPPGGHGPHSDPSLISKRGHAGGIYSWTKEDDMRLTEIMKKYKNPRDWEPIAKEHSRGKTAKECHERWIRYLKPGVRKGQWQDHEDAIVVEAVSTSAEQPFTRWSDLAQRLPGRVGKQIRDRWVNHLNPNINHLPFSREDDLNLWEGHKQLGKRWVEISTKYFNNSRSENHIKNRWYSASFKKFIANEFGPDAYTGGKSKDGKKDDKSKPKKTKVKSELASIIEAV